MERHVVARRLVFAALMAVGTFAATVPWRATGEIMAASQACVLPPGHPPIHAAPSLPPGHPPVDADGDHGIVQPPLLRSSRPEVTPVVNL